MDSLTNIKKSEAKNRNKLFNLLLSESVREVAERYIVGLAILGFLTHLFLIGLRHFGFFPEHELLSNTLLAIYTPFSIILIYEVYLLVYYLPKSISLYIGKQYEIITLVVIRKIFNDISNVEITSDWFYVSGDLQFTYDITASLIMFFLISLFYKQIPNRLNVAENINQHPNTNRFIEIKKWVSISLVLVLLFLAVFNFYNWLSDVSLRQPSEFNSLKELNKIFFEDFFTVLILTDVLLLLISFLYTQTFHHVMRNSGFIISTVLIKMSFGQDGMAGSILNIAAVSIGLLFMYIYSRYEKIQASN